MSAHGSYPSPDSFPALMGIVEQAHEADTGLVLTKASIHVLRDGVHAMYAAQLAAECRVESLTPEDVPVVREIAGQLHQIVGEAASGDHAAADETSARSDVDRWSTSPIFAAVPPTAREGVGALPVSAPAPEIAGK